MLLSTSACTYHYTNRKASRELNSKNSLNVSLYLGIAILRAVLIIKR